MPSQNVLVMTEETSIAEAVASAMGRNGDFSKRIVCATLEELAMRIAPSPPIAALVDIDLEPDRVLTQLESLITRFSQTRFIVLASDRGDELMLEAMQIGARHFLLKELIEADLQGVLDRFALTETKPAGKDGTLITVLSGGGGCGATTLAVNLANEFCVDGSESSLVVDMDDGYGAVASFLALKGEYGLRDVLIDRSRIDSALVRSTALTYSDQLSALIKPGVFQTNVSSSVDYEHLEAALNVFKQTYVCTVVDAPRLSTDVTTTLVNASDVVLLPFQLLVKDIRHVRETIATLRQSCTTMPRVDLVATRYRRGKSMVTFKEATLALDGAEIGCLCNDFSSATKAMNFGQPLAHATPRSKLRREIRKLAQKTRERHYLPQRAEGHER